jgi:hypothetical protein
MSPCTTRNNNNNNNNNNKNKNNNNHITQASFSHISRFPPNRQMGSTAPRAYEWDFLEPGSQARRGLDTEQVKRPLSPTPGQSLDKLQTNRPAKRKETY